MEMTDLISQFTEDLEFEALVIWADILDVEVNYPPLGDMWPDWEVELRQDVAEAMERVGK